MKTYRQGDVLILECARPTDVLEPIPLENGKIVLAHGEVTDHSHAIADEAARFALNAQTLQRFLDVLQPVRLKHEEHGEIQLPSGFYEIRIQREYEPGAIRNVAD